MKESLMPSTKRVFRLFNRWQLPVGRYLPALIFIILFAIAPLIIEDAFVLRMLLVSLYFGAQAMVYDFTNGFIGVSNFGFAGFLGLGGYTSAILVKNLGVSPWIGLVTGTVAGGLLGLLTGTLTLRLRGIYAACMSWFVQMALVGLVTVNVDLTRGTLGLIVPYYFDTASIIPYYYMLLILAFIIFIILTAIVRSHIGLAFRAIGQNQMAARASGVNPTKYKVLNWTIACAFAGLLGAYYAHFVGILTPDIMHFRHTVEVLALSFIGGRGSLWGGLLSSLIVIPTFEYLKPLLELRLIIYGLLLVFTMIFYPAGLVGVLRTLRGLLIKIKVGSKGDVQD
jgi:branched-chain amino acid transport system permease protein